MMPERRRFPVVLETQNGRGDVREADQAPALQQDTETGGHHAPIVLDNHGQDSRLVASEQSPTLSEKMGTGGNNVPLVVEPTIIDTKHEGRLRESDIAPTLIQPSPSGGGVLPIIAFSSKDDGRDATEDITPTLRSTNYNESHVNGGGPPAVALDVRNLTEIEELSAPIQSKGAGGHSLNFQNPVMVKGSAIGRKPEAGPQRGEIDESGQSYTLNRTEVHAVAEHRILRRLTPRETERLQGFEDDWSAMCSDTQRYRQMGNAVTVNVIEWIGKRLKEETTK